MEVISAEDDLTISAITELQNPALQMRASRRQATLPKEYNLVKSLPAARFFRQEMANTEANVFVDSESGAQQMTSRNATNNK
jgi:hypothetical protein